MSDLCLYINEDMARRSERRRCSPDVIYCCCNGANNTTVSVVHSVLTLAVPGDVRGTFEFDLSQFSTL